MNLWIVSCNESLLMTHDMNFWWPDVPWTRVLAITLSESDVFLLFYQSIYSCLSKHSRYKSRDSDNFRNKLSCSCGMFHFSDRDRAFQPPCKAGEITRYINAFLSKHLPRIPDAFNDDWTTVHRWLPRYGITHKLYYDNNHRMRHIDFFVDNDIFSGQIRYSNFLSNWYFRIFLRNHEKFNF